VLIITRRSPTSCGAANITLVGAGTNCKNSNSHATGATSGGDVVRLNDATASIVVPVTVEGTLGPSVIVNGDFETVVRCTFSNRNLHSRMPVVPSSVRLKLLHACDQWHASRGAHSSYRLTL
jgi:hypothetical protein